MKPARCETCGRRIDRLSSVQALVIGGGFLFNGILIYPYWRPSSELVESGAGRHIFFVGFAVTVAGFMVARFFANLAPSMAGKIMLMIAGVVWILSGLGVLVHLAGLARGGT